jgi:hypothetical protein
MVPVGVQMDVSFDCCKTEMILQNVVLVRKAMSFVEAHHVVWIFLFCFSQVMERKVQDPVHLQNHKHQPTKVKF